MKELRKLNLNNKKYIIFDLDGTLVDSMGVWNRTDQELIKKYAGITINQDIIQIDRNNFFDLNQNGDIYNNYCKYLIKKYNFFNNKSSEILKRRISISKKILQKEAKFKSNVVELVFILKELGFVLILATVATNNEIKIYTEKNKELLSQMNICEVFDYIITKEDVEFKKPNPEIYNKIMLKYNASSEECLVFEDSYTGVLACNNAGIEVVTIYDMYADIDREKINSNTDYAINNYKEFIDFIDKKR